MNFFRNVLTVNDAPGSVSANTAFCTSSSVLRRVLATAAFFLKVTGIASDPADSDVAAWKYV